MKFSFVLISILLSACANNLKMPQGLPEPVGNEIHIYSVAAEIDFARKLYPDLKKADLAEIDEGYLLGEGIVSVSSNIITLVNSSFQEAPKGTALCFIPRHKLVYQSKLGQVEVDVCFSCRKTLVTIDGWSRYFYHRSSMQDEVNKIFSSAGLRLPVDE